MRATSRLLNNGNLRGAFAHIKTGAMLPANTFKGEVVLVTGGGTGLGKAMATRLSSLGATVAIASRRRDVVDAAALEIGKETGGVVVPLTLDVRDAGAVTACFDEATRLAGAPISMLINNAAGNFVSPFARLSPNAVSTVIDIVLKGTAFCTLEAGKRWIAGGTGGVVLNITTTYAECGSAFVVPSAMAKAGVLNLTRSLATEWGKHGIRINALAPGPIVTEGAFSRLDPSGEFQEKLRKRLPAGRLGSTAELSNIASFMLSPYASWLTGQQIQFDGGEGAALAGEFNILTSLPDSTWDQMEAQIRATNKKGKGGGA